MITDWMPDLPELPPEVRAIFDDSVNVAADRLAAKGCETAKWEWRQVRFETWEEQPADAIKVAFVANIKRPDGAEGRAYTVAIYRPALFRDGMRAAVVSLIGNDAALGLLSLPV